MYHKELSNSHGEKSNSLLPHVQPCGFEERQRYNDGFHTFHLRHHKERLKTRAGFGSRRVHDVQYPCQPQSSTREGSRVINITPQKRSGKSPGDHWARMMLARVARSAEEKE